MFVLVVPSVLGYRGLAGSLHEGPPLLPGHSQRDTPAFKVWKPTPLPTASWLLRTRCCCHPCPLPCLGIFAGFPKASDPVTLAEGEVIKRASSGGGATAPDFGRCFRAGPYSRGQGCGSFRDLPLLGSTLVFRGLGRLSPPAYRAPCPAGGLGFHLLRDRVFSAFSCIQDVSFQGFAFS